MIVENKCPSCGGELAYNFNLNELKCGKCSKIVTFETNKTSNEKHQFNSDSTIKNNRNDNMTYKCENCGRTSVFKKEDDVLKCEFCGSSNLNKTSKVDYIPDGIIPFKLNEKQAKTSFLNWIKKKKFLPKNLRTKISKSFFEAKYIPIYNYDFSCSTYYRGTGVNYDRDANGEETTTFHNFDGTTNNNFNDYFESANSSINSNSLRGLGSFGFNDLHVFRTEYLYGVTTLETNIDLQQNCLQAQFGIKNIISTSIKNSIHYDEIRNFVCETTFNKKNYNYVYVPAWFHSFNYKNKKYSFFINGSTGTVCGKVPRSPAKILFTILGFLLGAGAIALMIYLLCK